MLITSNEANKLIKSYQEELKRLNQIESQSCSFVASTTENVEDVRPSYNFADTQKQLQEIQSKIRKIKHALNLFNTTTKLDDFDITIDEALVYLPQLNTQLDKLKSMSFRLEKSRCRYSNNTIDYEYANYSILDASIEYDKVKTTIIRLQSALDRVNNSIQFELSI